MNFKQKLLLLAFVCRLGLLYAQAPIHDAGVLIITLGTDTTFIHRFEIRGDSFRSDILSTPQGLRLTEGKGVFFPNGNLKSLSSRVMAPVNSGEWQTVQHTELSTTADSMVILLTRDGKTTRRAYAGHCILTNSGDAASFQLFPFYGFRAPKKTGDSLLFKHVNPIGSRDFTVKRLEKRKVLVRSSFMGAITLYLDKKDRLLSIDALGSSLNFNAKAYRDADFEALKKQFLRKQLSGAAPLVVSTRDTLVFEQDKQKITVNYWRPSARGRQVFGGIVPKGKFWRLGANNATEISFSSAVAIENKTLPAGAYSLFVLPGETDWQLCFNSKTKIWGTEYDPATDVLRVKMKEESLPEHVEKLHISIVPGPSGNIMQVDWEKTRLSVVFEQGN
ncbi:MAG: DUF2911 domain-containing protein [Saprospiraceae bacterium]|nr:DUF2911 domain-containing protein [Saprospiraceae bacterium]